MPKINFYPRFADLVQSGQLTQAIRLRSLLPGDLVQLLCGTRELGRGCCTMVREISISYSNYVPIIRVDGVVLSAKGMEEFSRKCGFPDLDALIDFHSEYFALPLSGRLVVWELQDRVTPMANGVIACPTT